MPNLESRLQALEQRNHRVDLNKAWETSLTRRLTISLITYVFASLILIHLSTPNWPIASLIPVCGYWLSTLSLPLIRQAWEKNYH